MPASKEKGNKYHNYKTSEIKMILEAYNAGVDTKELQEIADKIGVSYFSVVSAARFYGGKRHTYHYEVVNTRTREVIYKTDNQGDIAAEFHKRRAYVTTIITNRIKTAVDYKGEHLKVIIRKVDENGKVYNNEYYCK